MSTWRNVTYMRRRQLRLMAEEQQREFMRQQRQALLATCHQAEQLLMARARHAAGYGAAATDAAATTDAWVDLTKQLH